MLASMRNALLSALLLAASASPAAAQLGPGAAAPEIEAKDWWNAPEAGTTLEELRGRVVFLEFWATW